MMRFIPFLALLCGMAMVLTVPTMARGTTTPHSLATTADPATVNGGGVLEVCSPLGNTPIPDDNGTGITSVINVGEASQILDLNVRLSITHSFVGDLYISLTNNGTTRYLLDRPWGGNCNGDNLDDIYSDDEATLWIEQDCSYNGPAYIAGESYYSGEESEVDQLAVFDNRSTAGEWVLNVQDRNNNDIGALRQWCVQFTIPGPTPTPTATPTEPPLPTETPTPTPTSTPNVPPTVTPTPTATRTPNPDTRYMYLSSALRGAITGNCQSVENEEGFPNNTIGEARATRPLCNDRPFQGVHNTADNREDIFRLDIAEGAAGLYRFALDVPDINLSLRLYDTNVEELNASTNPATEDEQFEETLSAGTYFVRIYRADEAISEQPYTFTLTPLN